MDGVAVDRRIVMRWHVACRAQIFGEDAAARIRERDRFGCGNHRHAGGQNPQRLFGAHEFATECETVVRQLRHQALAASTSLAPATRCSYGSLPGWSTSNS